LDVYDKVLTPRDSSSSQEQLRDLGRGKVELELPVLNYRWKMGKFGGRVVSLQRLETDPYLGKKERVRLDVFRRSLCSHKDLTCNVFPPQDARCSMTRRIRRAST
jgi:hypothetical protein